MYNKNRESSGSDKSGKKQVGHSGHAGECQWANPLMKTNGRLGFTISGPAGKLQTKKAGKEMKQTDNFIKPMLKSNLRPCSSLRSVN